MKTQIEPELGYANSEPILPIYSYDFKTLISKTAGLTNLEITTDFRIGSDPDLEKTIYAALKESSFDDLTELQIKMLSSVKVFGYLQYHVFLTGTPPNHSKYRKKFINVIAKWFDHFAKKYGFSWRFYGFVTGYIGNIPNASDASFNGGIIYSDREDKSESAVAFLNRVYAEQLAEKSITLSELRTLDNKLWKALWNWRGKGNDLSEIIPSGRTSVGRPRRPLPFDPSKLDPSDPIHAEVIRSEKQREARRQSAAASYARLKR